jgi:hypothetical protein
MARKPLFPLIHGLEDVNLPDSLVEASNTPSFAHFDEMGDQGAVLVSILRYLRQAILCRKHRVGVPQGIRIILNVAEFQILDHIQDEVVTPQDHRYKTMILAIHVFLYAGLRQLPTMGPMVRLLVSRLRDALQAPGNINSEAWKDNQADLVWVLFVGAAASYVPSVRQRVDYVTLERYGDRASWFSERLELAVRLLGIKSQSTLEDVLRRYVWADEFGRAALGRFWEQLGSAEEQHGRHGMP